ncbi:hypothetical protein YC2023_094620 [Brassica napus]
MSPPVSVTATHLLCSISQMPWSLNGWSRLIQFPTCPQEAQLGNPEEVIKGIPFHPFLQPSQRFEMHQRTFRLLDEIYAGFKNDMQHSAILVVIRYRIPSTIDRRTRRRSQRNEEDN